MAVLEKATNNYFKIDFDNCSVRGLKVFVKFFAYADAAEREKEKAREGKIAEFFRKLRENLQTQRDNLFMQIEAAGFTPEQVLSPAEENKIDAAKFPALRELQERWNALEPYERRIGDSLYRYGNSEPPCFEASEEIMQQLTELGFEEEWITDPIHITAGAEVCAGDYGGEPISQEFYYGRLKTVMGETDDC